MMVFEEIVNGVVIFTIKVTESDTDRRVRLPFPPMPTLRGVTGTGV